MKSLFSLLLILCIFVKLLRCDEDLGESPPEEPLDDTSPIEYLFEEKDDGNSTVTETPDNSNNTSNSTQGSPTEGPATSPTIQPTIQLTNPPTNSPIEDPSALTNFILWDLMQSKWWVSDSAINYDAISEEPSNYAISPLVSFSSGVLYQFTFTVAGEKGSAVIEISFANMSNFNPIETFLISGPGNSTKRDTTPQITQYSFTANFPAAEYSSLILKVSAASSDALFTISNFQLTTTSITSPAPTCTDYLGFQVYQIEKLLTSYSSQQLRHSVVETIKKLQKLKEKIIHHKHLAYDLPLGKWIDIFNSFKDGNACEFSFQDFDTWTWLFNYQIASTIQSVDNQPIMRRK